MNVFLFILNCICISVFWNAHDVAMNEDRRGWALLYLFISALNGAVVMITIF